MKNFLGNNADQGDDPDEEEDYCDIKDKLSAVYGDEWRKKSSEDLMDDKYFKEIPEFLQSKKILTCDSVSEIEYYVYMDSQAHKFKNSEFEFYIITNTGLLLKRLGDRFSNILLYCSLIIPVDICIYG